MQLINVNGWNALAWSSVTPPAGIAGLRDVFMLSPTKGLAVGDTAAEGEATIIHWDGIATSTSTTTTPPPEWKIPGFPIESILAGLVGDAVALKMIRHRRNLRP